MGDRSNLYFRGVDIGVYAHWSGKDMATAAIRVLENPAFLSRVGDPAYATRIGVQTLLEALGSKSDSDLGFGLWTSKTGPCDAGIYDIIVIDTLTGRLFVTKNWKKPPKKDWVPEPTAETLVTLMQNW